MKREGSKRKPRIAERLLPAGSSSTSRLMQTDPWESSRFSKSDRVVPVKPSERLQIRCCGNACMAARLSSVFPHLQTPTLFPPRMGRHLESKSVAPAPSFAFRGSPQQQPLGCRSAGWALSGQTHPCPFTPCIFLLSPLHGQGRA